MLDTQGSACRVVIELRLTAQTVFHSLVGVDVFPVDVIDISHECEGRGWRGRPRKDLEQPVDVDSLAQQRRH